MVRGGFRAVLGRPVGDLGPSWSDLGGRLVEILERFVRSCYVQRVCVCAPVPSKVRVCAHLAALEAVLGRFGVGWGGTLRKLFGFYQR